MTSCLGPEAYRLYHTHQFSHRLGDRHGENLLFEEGTGGILHVDFNCLFDKVGGPSFLPFCSLLTHFNRAKRSKNPRWFHSASLII